MYKLDDYILYKKEACLIGKIKEKYFKDKDYYELIPLRDKTLKIDVPIDSKFLTDLLTKDEVLELIEKIPTIPVIESKIHLIENEYKALLVDASYEDLIKIIKTTYLRNEKRLLKHKRAGDIDTDYFNKAEGYLYPIFSIVLDLSIDDIKDMVLSKIKEDTIES